MAVKNHKLGLVTKTSNHKAHSFGPTDVCYREPCKAGGLVLSDNYNVSEKLAAGTVRTYVQSASVMTAADRLDEGSLPAHDGMGGGIISETYMGPTYPITYSPDCRAEGNGVVRTSDLSWQNKNNTMGSFSIMTAEDEARLAKDVSGAKDKLVTVEGACSHGRVLDWPRGASKTGEAVYLEVLNTCSVILKAVRVNALEKGKPPACDAAEPHPKWIGQVSGAGVATATDTKAGEMYQVPGGFIDVPGFEKPEPEPDELEISVEFEALNDNHAVKFKDDGEPHKAFEVHGPGAPFLGLLLGTEDVEFMPHDQDDAEFRQSLKDRYANRLATKALGGVPARPEPPQKKHVPRTERRELARAYKKSLEKFESRKKGHLKNESLQGEAQRMLDKHKNRRFVGSSIQGLITGAGSFIKFLQHWNALNNAPLITATATACSGPKQATLKVFPAGAQTYDLFSDTLSTLIEPLNKFSRFAKEGAAIFGREEGVVIEAFVDPRVDIEVEYKELVKDRPEKGLTQGCVGRAWRGQIAFEKLVYGFVEFTTPLYRALATCPPAAGVMGALSFLGVEVDFYLKIELGVKLALFGVWNEYEEHEVVLEAEVKCEIQLGAKLLFWDYNEIAVCLFLEGKVELKDPHIGKEAALTFTWSAGLQGGIKLWAHFDVWGFRENWDFAWQPEGLKLETPEMTIQLFKVD